MTLLQLASLILHLKVRHFKNEGRVSFRKEFWDRYWSRAIELSGTLRSNDATATRTSLKKWICVLSVFIAIIPTHLLCQIYANPPILSFFLSFIYLLRYIVDSIKVALGIGNWQLGIEHSGIRNNVMICLSDHQCPKHPWISYIFVAHLCSQCRFSLCCLGISASSLWTRAPTKR